MQISQGPVRYREWVQGPSRGVAGALLGAIGLAGGVWLFSRGGFASIAGGSLLALFSAAFGATSWCFRRLVIVVDDKGIAWSFGPIGRRYGFDEISMFRERDFVVHSKDREGRGWGIGQGKDGVDVYQTWGGNGPALDLVVRRDEVTKHYLVSSAAPDRLVVALVQAMKAGDP